MDGRLLAVLLFMTIFWVFFVLNTELVIRWNQPTSTDSGPTWQFGQVSIIIEYSGLHRHFLPDPALVLVSSAVH
jgi:hypothetical protein